MVDQPEAGFVDPAAAAPAATGGWDDAAPAVPVEEVAAPVYADPAAATGWDAAAPAPTEPANAGW